MAGVLDLIKRDSENLFTDCQVHFVFQKKLNSVNCVCNSCCCSIFIGITTENFVTFKYILYSHLSDGMHFRQSVQCVDEKSSLGIKYSGKYIENLLLKQKFMNKLSSYFTADNFKIIKNQLSVIFVGKYILHFNCDFCSTEFIMHFKCDLLTTIINHFIVYHKRPQVLSSNLENHRMADPSLEPLRKLLHAKQRGLFKFYLSCYKENGILTSGRGKETNEILINHQSSNNILTNGNKSKPKVVTKQSSERSMIQNNLTFQTIEKKLFGPKRQSGLKTYPNCIGPKESSKCLINKKELRFQKMKKEIKTWPDGNVQKQPSEKVKSHVINKSIVSIKKIKRKVKPQHDDRLRIDQSTFKQYFCSKPNRDWQMISKNEVISYLKSRKSVEKNLMKSCTNLQNKKNLSIVCNRESDMESILNFMMSVSVSLTKEQVYFIVNEKHSIDCYCNICFSRLFENITELNFHLFKQRLRAHLLAVKHSIRLKLFIDRENQYDFVVKNNVDFKNKFIDKICKCFSENCNSIKSKLDVQRLRDKIVLVSCDYCTKVYVMHVTCKLETSFVRHLKNVRVHENDLKKVYFDVNQPKQFSNYHYEVGEEKFVHIFKNFPKSLHNFSLKLNENGDVKIFCTLCRRSLPYNYEQPLKRITKLVECHIKNNVNHLCKDSLKESKKANRAKQRFQYPEGFFLKETLMSSCSFDAVLKENLNEAELLRSGEVIETMECYSKQSNVSGKVKNMSHLEKHNSQRSQVNFSSREQFPKIVPIKNIFHNQYFYRKTQNSPVVLQNQKTRNRNKKDVHRSESKPIKNKKAIKMNCTFNHKVAKNNTRGFSKCKNIVDPSGIDFKTRCTSSMLISKKMQVKLQRHQKIVFDYLPLILHPKYQRRNDFFTAMKWKAKRRKKEYQISKQLHALNRRKQEFMITKMLEGIRQRRNTISLLHMNTVKSRKYNFSALVNLEVLSTMGYVISREKYNLKKKLLCIKDFSHYLTPKRNEENADDDFKMVTKSMSVDEKRCNTISRYVNDYLNRCFQKYFIDRNDIFSEIIFFSVITKSEEINLLCMLCGDELPFDCNLPLEDLSYVATLHVEYCFNSL